MPIPDFQTVMRPLLELLTDGRDWPVRDIREALAERFAMTSEELAERLPSGRVTTFQSRVGWAATFLYNTKLLARPRRAVYTITDRGRHVLEREPDRVDLRVLAQFEELAAFRGRVDHRGGTPAVEPQPVEEPSVHTPNEQIEAAFRILQTALADELLQRISEQSPAFFEDLVLSVLRAMGYGGTGDLSERLGQSGDGGVDGVIREDPLGLDLIYVQAKRWSGVVGRPEIQKFFGALHGRRATKGVFLTTASFSSQAVAYAENVTPRVILVDGAQLARLMIDHSVGVTTTRAYEVKRVDPGFFEPSESDTL